MREKDKDLARCMASFFGESNIFPTTVEWRYICFAKELGEHRYTLLERAVWQLPEHHHPSFTRLAAESLIRRMRIARKRAQSC